ncbi:MAG: hypothetical protein IJ630_01405 [Treponema sp.]|nr:hypothetical protein [Treponema sp.]
MKKLFKTLAVLAAVAALGFGFVSCGDPEDDNNGNSGSGSIPTEGIAASFKDVDNSYSSDEEAKEKAENSTENSEDGYREYGWKERFIYFYENGTYISFQHECYYIKRNGKVEKLSDKTLVNERGTYELTGTYDSGSIVLTKTLHRYNDKMYEVGTQYQEPVTIENGKFSYSDGYGNGRYEKQ